MEPEALPPGWEIRWADPAGEHLPPPEDWWHHHDSEAWRNPELPFEDGKVLIFNAEPLPPEEVPVILDQLIAAWFGSKKASKPQILCIEVMDSRDSTQGKMAGNRMRSQPILTFHPKIHKGLTMNEAKIEIFTPPSPAPHPTRGPQAA